MLNVEKVFNLFLAHGVDFFTGVPDSLLKNICAYITDHASAGKHIIAANEGTAVGIALSPLCFAPQNIGERPKER